MPSKCTFHSKIRRRCRSYAEWFQWSEQYLTFDSHGKIVDSPPCGTVTQLRSPEQKLTLDTSGEGPCLIVSTSPSVAAGVPDGPAADCGALVCFIGQVPVRCRGRVDVGDQLVPSMLHDGCAVSLREYFVTQRAARRGAADHNGGIVAAIGGFAPDSLGVAMEAGNPQDGEEHILLCFVRWNHAVRRELREQLDRVGAKVSSCWMSHILNSITITAYFLIILEIVTLLSTFAHPSGVKHRHPVHKFIIFFALLQFILVVTLFVAFSSDSITSRGRVVLTFWLGFVILFIAFLFIQLNLNDEASFGIAKFLLLFALNLYHIAYNFALIYAMAEIRGGNIFCSFCAPHNGGACVDEGNPSANRQIHSTNAIAKEIRDDDQVLPV